MWVECQACACEVPGSNLTNGYCVPTSIQCAIAPGLIITIDQQKLASEQAYQVMH